MNKDYYIRKKKFELIKNNKNYICNIKTNEYIYSTVIKYSHLDRKYFLKNEVNISLSGRIILKRKIGKIIFITIQDIFEKIQIYLSYKFLLKINFDKILDIGDIISIKGKLFKTKVNELTINCNKLCILSKCFISLPEKFKGLNIENKSKKRYLDLISDKKSMHVFKIRSKIILEIRKYLNYKDFIEVETPILQPIIGGADANPFVTKSINFKKELFLRISPELYLKKLIIGGFNKIFEIGKNFRNEGISYIHNPEFTMLELYIAYKDYYYLIKLIQNLIKYLCLKLFNSLYINYNNIILDFNKKYKIFSMKNLICKFNNINNININSYKELISLAKSKNIEIKDNYSLGKIQFEIFKKTVERNLIQPTIVTEYPIEISTLSKKNYNNENLADRFELFINGMEIANGYSELNDPDDQLNRFINQNKINNKNSYDKNYINALNYGMPPTAGLGIGIDRLIMLFTNTNNIKNIILFPIIRYKN